MSAAAKNLEVIQAAVVKHNGNCPGELLRIEINPFEYERLGWDDFRGIPIVPEEKVPTGRFNLVCELDEEPALEEGAMRELEEQRELVTVGGGDGERHEHDIYAFHPNCRCVLS